MKRKAGSANDCLANDRFTYREAVYLIRAIGDGKADAFDPGFPSLAGFRGRLWSFSSFHKTDITVMCSPGASPERTRVLYT